MLLGAVLTAAVPACGSRPATLDDLPDDTSCRTTVLVGPLAEVARARADSARALADSLPATADAPESSEPTAADTILAVRPDDTAQPDGGEDGGESDGGESDGGAIVATDGTGDDDDPPLARQLAMEWRLPPESVDVSQLNAWCAAVGPAVVGSWTDPVLQEDLPPLVDSLFIVAWNGHIGGGDARGLVEDLRSGALTGGQEVEHFVLLLQEVHRQGELVPEHDPGLPGGGGTTPAPPHGDRVDVVGLAEELGLWVMYAPAMRNGPHEDRGNAILSTIPLADPVAVALPVARQRRVTIAATLTGRRSSGEPWSLQVASVHLESQPQWWRSPEAERLEQAEALVSLLPEASAAVAGGDFNTKTRGREEALVGVMLRSYPDTPPFPTGPTYQKAYGIYREYLDYLFFRLPDGAAADYRRVDDIYGSDHYPMIGWIRW
jgi:endonuclease/exonuclease/phosphatase family metal-dependent hydrolase